MISNTKKILCFVMIFTIVLNFTSCKKQPKETEPKNLSKEVKTLNEDYFKEIKLSGDENIKWTGFGLNMFKQIVKNDNNENVLISPVSIASALSMTANGAQENTLSQIEQVLGTDIEKLNLFYRKYENSLSEDGEQKLNLNNSIWFNNKGEVKINDEFLEKNSYFYGTDIFGSKFNENTLNNMNDWIKNKTNGTIEKVVDKISDNSIMFIINTLYFNDNWNEQYTRSFDDDFNAYDSTKQLVPFMSAMEHYFLEDDDFTGFVKFYEDNRHAFVALLPNENKDINDMVDSLDANKLTSLIKKKKNTRVFASMPKFTSNYKLNVKDTLKALGMTDAFDPEKANFNGLGSSKTGNIYINKVLHNTYINVDEKGTEAGAATVVEVEKSAAPQNKPKRIILDRPFVYIIWDFENNVPVFLGVIKKI